MNIFVWIIAVIGGIFGVVLVGGTVLGMIGIILFKVYRKLRYHISLYD